MAIGQIGDIIGKLTVLDRKRENNRTYCYCKCECGNKTWIRADTLKIVRSCGCLSKETQFKSKDITGQRFGRLTAIEQTDQRDKNNGCVIWKCKCDCGNTIYASERFLNNGSISSCGCLGTENSKQNMQKAIKKHLEKHIVENTNIQVIGRDRPFLNNTSGVTGVMWDKSKNKWIAVIYFQKKRYYLGRYINKQDAINARKEAEQKYHKNFLQWYYNKFKSNKEE